MSKGLLKAAVCALMAGSLLVGCGQTTTNEANADAQYKVGLVTNIGTIDDKSFNQGAWEGIQAASQEYSIESKYLQPVGETDAEALNEIANFSDAGYNLVVAPGFKFGTTVYEAQSKYPDMKFVAIDTVAHNGDNVAAMNDNTVAILFEESQAGFLAGVAAALELKEGEAGFIGGMETDAVKKFNWGFQQGINYANSNYGTALSMKPENFIYQGTFTDIAAGQQLSAQLYDKGVDVIFSAAGAVGTGVIKEARERAGKGENVWVIGVDVDQYDDGIYEGDKSVILTSAMKKINVATQDVIKQAIDGTFKGGQTLIYSIENDGVGLPEENPNLSEETVKTVNEVYEGVKNGSIVVASTGEGLLP